MQNLFLVALGGALGASLRYLTGLAALRLTIVSFPWPTMLVNILGCLAMGAVFAWLQSRPDVPHGAGLFLMTGVLGGFTTFSAFSLEAILLWQRGEQALSATYILASVTLSIAGLLAGLWLARVKMG